MSNQDAFDVSLSDTHCHVDLFPDPNALVKMIDARRIHTIAVTNAPSVFAHTEGLGRLSLFLHPAAGLHPELVATHAHELDRLWPCLERTRFVGEVGLDYTTTDVAVRERQRGVLTTILDRCASAGDKVITVHSRRAASDTIAIIGARYPGRVILHWFSGTRKEIERAVDAGLYFSVNCAMLRSKKGQELVMAMPKDRVLAESDGPFVQTKGQAAGPDSVREVVEMLASAWRAEPSETAATLARNLPF